MRNSEVVGRHITSERQPVRAAFLAMLLSAAVSLVAAGGAQGQMAMTVTPETQTVEEQCCPTNGGSGWV